MADPLAGILSSGLTESKFLGMVAFTVAIIIYAVFVWYFYRFLGSRDVFKWDVEAYARSGGLGRLARGFAYFVKYLVAYPILVFVWFGVLSSFMFVLVGSVDVQRILIVSFSLVTAIRVCSYYREELSLELAKLIPFAMLASFIMQPASVSLDVTQRASEVGAFVADIFGFLLLSATAEWMIRIIWSIKRHFAPHRHQELNIAERFGR